MHRSRKITIATSLLIVVVIGTAAWWLLKPSDQDQASKTAASSQQSENTAQGQVKSQATTRPSAKAFDKKQHSLDDPASLWVVANKRRPLNPPQYAPQTAAPAMQLRLAASYPEMQISSLAVADMEALANAATAAGLPLMFASGYRSYSSQVAVYNNEVRNYGQAQADRQSARPGHSEHQTGLAADLAPASGECLIAECFGELPEGQWLAAHAHEYGFIIRYPQGKEAVTGYLYEPWHVRYVGRDLAAEIHRQQSTDSDKNLTLEEFFGLPAAPTY